MERAKSLPMNISQKPPPVQQICLVQVFIKIQNDPDVTRPVLHLGQRLLQTDCYYWVLVVEEANIFYSGGTSKSSNGLTICFCSHSR